MRRNHTERSYDGTEFYIIKETGAFTSMMINDDDGELLRTGTACRIVCFIHMGMLSNQWKLC
jgi:hypothetical protein